jgi:hypothetical protein
MFILKSPDNTKSVSGIDERAYLVGIQSEGKYPSLDAAIEAALKAGMDLEAVVIEKQNCAHASVNDWIAVRIAGGLLAAG